MIIRCSCRSSFRSLLPFHSQNSRHIFRLPRSVRGKRRGKPLIYIAPYVLGAQPFKSFRPGTIRLASSRLGFVRPLFGVVRLRLEYWQGSRRRPRVCGCGWWSAGPPCGGLAGRGAYLARLGRFRGRWRRYGLRLVLYLGRVPCRAFAGRLRALWRGGWCCGLSVLLAWPLRAPFRWRWCCLDWWRVVLAAVAGWAAPVTAVAGAGAIVKRAHRRGPCAGSGGVALVAWSGCQRTGAAGVAGAVAVFVVAVAGVEPAPPVAVLQWSRPWPLRAVVISLRGWRCIP